jgi:hypothetical protein
MGDELEVERLVGEGLANIHRDPVVAALNLLLIVKGRNRRRDRVFLQKRFGRRRGRRICARARRDGWF